MTITETKAARHRLTAVYIDGQRYMIDTETFLLSGYRVGDPITQLQLEQLKEVSENNRAYEKALYLLEYRAHSRGELLTKITREYAKEAALQAVERVEALGLIDDEAFARQLAEELTRQKGYGPGRVKADLMRRGIDRDIIDAILQELPADQTHLCKAWLQKKVKTIPADPKEQAKILAAGVRRGFDYATVREAFRDLSQESEEALWQFE
ncbi:MAG: regulatory protein RecX [Clostridia bacterium]|nr:regulatory protein RecX [Clostridia bacterium]